MSAQDQNVETREFVVAAVPPVQLADWEVAGEVPRAETPTPPGDLADRCLLCGHTGKGACFTARDVGAMFGAQVDVLTPGGWQRIA